MSMQQVSAGVSRRSRWAPSAEPEAGHQGPTSCVAVRADGITASGGYDGAILLWNPVGELVKRLPGHASLVNAVAWSPTGGALASASSDHSARVWREDGEQVADLRGHGDDVNSVAWSPDGTRLCTASFDGTARIWSVETGECIAELAEHESDVNGVACSPAGDRIATASDDGSVRIWDAAGLPLHALEGHADWVDQVAFAPDGALLASASLDGTARVWSPEDGRCVAVLADHECTVKAVAWSPDGRFLATAAYDKKIRIFSRQDWRCLRSVQNATMWNRSLAWGRADRITTGSFSGAPVVWRLDEQRARSSDVHGTPGINGMAVSPDGRTAALACDDGASRLVDLESGRVSSERFDHAGAVLDAGWSADGQRVAFAGWDGGVSIFACDHEAPLCRPELGPDPINSLAFSDDSREIATGSFTGQLARRDAGSGVAIADLVGHHGSVKVVRRVPAGRGFVSAGRDGDIHWYRVGDEAPTRVIRVGTTIVNGVAASSDGRRVACATRSCGIEVFELDTGARVASFREHPVSSRCVAFSPDDHTLAAGYYDGHVLLWSPDEGRARLLLPFGPTPISSVTFAPDGKRLWVSTWSPQGVFGEIDAESGELRRLLRLA